VLSHLLGFSLFFTFALDKVLPDRITGFYPTETPIRLIAIWLLVDRNWRVGRIRLGFWDYTYLVFLLCTAVGMVWNSLNPALPITYFGYRTWVAEVARYYLAFLVVRESCYRVGFRPDIMINWLLAAFAWSAFLGVMQALDVPGVRRWSWNFYNQLFFEGMSQPNQSRGTADHANNMAFEMVIATCIVLGQILRRKPRLYEIGLVCLFVAGLVGTQSRGGLIAFFAMIVGAIIYLYWNRKAWTGTLIVAIGISLALIGLSIVEIYNIERFKRVIYGERVTSQAGLGSFAQRVEGRRHAFRLIDAFPVFGTGPNSLLYYNPRVAFWSYYGTRQIVDGVYWRLWADTGIFGLLFVFCVLGYLLSHVRRDIARRPFSFSVFLFGVVISAHGIVENFVLVRGMIVVNVFVALAFVPAIIHERGRRENLLDPERQSGRFPIARPTAPALPAAARRQSQ
jgi:hypothetical protein